MSSFDRPICINSSNEKNGGKVNSVADTSFKIMLLEFRRTTNDSYHDSGTGSHLDTKLPISP